MEESIKRTRIEIVASGIDFLLTHSDGISRKQFFLTDPKDTNRFDNKKIALLAKANTSKDWQQKVLDRLINSGLIKKINYINGIGYQIDNFAKAKIISDNFKNGDGLLVAHYVFPAEVPAPEVIITRTESATLSDVKDGEEISIEELLKKLLANIVYIRSNQDEGPTHIIEALKVFKAHLTHNEQIQEKQVVADQALTTLFKNFENRINGSNKRIEDLTEAVKQQSLLLEANQRTSKEILTAASDITKLSTSLLKLDSLVSGVDALTKELKTSQQNSLVGLTNKLGSSIKEMTALQEELLNVSSKIEGSQDNEH